QNTIEAVVGECCVNSFARNRSDGNRHGQFIEGKRVVPNFEGRSLRTWAVDRQAGGAICAGYFKRVAVKVPMVARYLYGPSSSSMFVTKISFPDIELFATSFALKISV